MVRFVEDGHSRHAAAAHFKAPVSFVVNLIKAYLASVNLTTTNFHRRLALRRSCRACRERRADGTAAPSRSMSRPIRRGAQLTRFRIILDAILFLPLTCY